MRSLIRAKLQVAKLPKFASTAALTLLDRPDRPLHTSPTKKPPRNNSTHPNGESPTKPSARNF